MDGMTDTTTGPDHEFEAYDANPTICRHCGAILPAACYRINAARNLDLSRQRGPAEGSAAKPEYLPALKPPQQVTISALTHSVLEMDARKRGISLETHLDRVIRAGMFMEDQILAGNEMLVRVGDDVRAVEWSPHG
jgi:hypothetical protein